MLIVCPSCATSYEVALATLSPQGRQVRCTRCRTVWHAELSQADKLLAAAAAIAPASEHAATEPVAAMAEEAPTPSSPENESPAPDAPADATADGADLPPLPDAANAAEAAEHVYAPPLVPGDDAPPPIEVAAESDAPVSEPPEDIETVAARRMRRRSRRRSLRVPLSPLQAGILALALVNLALVVWRTDVVRAMPQTAAFYAMLGLPVNLRGLTFDNVVTATEQHDGVPILIIEGNVYNGTRKAEEVPRLKFIVRNSARQEIYSWAAVPTRNVLQPGEVEPFRARLASPPADAHDLVVRFVNRRDILAGTR